MIKHVYLIKLKDRAQIPEAMEQLRSLKTHIPEIDHIEVARDFSGAKSALDILQVCEFSTQEKFDIFTNHPYHEKIRQYLKTVTECAYKVDCLCE